MFKKTFILTMLLTVKCASAADATSNPAEVLLKNEEGVCSIYVTGTTNNSMLQEFKKQDMLLLSETCTEKQVVLNSGGGAVDPAYEIGKIVRNNGYNTLIKVTDQCNSACGLIFIAGIERVVEKTKNNRHSLVGFHSFGVSGKCVTRTEGSNLVEEKYIPMQLKTYNYAAHMLGRETGIKFGNLIYSIGCKDLIWANPHGLVEVRFATKINNVKG